MTRQFEAASVHEYTQQETLAVLLEELIEGTKKVTAGVENNDPEILELIKRREATIKKIEHVAAEMRNREEDDAGMRDVIRQAFREVAESSAELQDALARKSKAALAVLHSLQQKRFYTERENNYGH